jgi:hypothetical protein
MARGHAQLSRSTQAIKATCEAKSVIPGRAPSREPGIQAFRKLNASRRSARYPICGEAVWISMLRIAPE